MEEVMVGDTFERKSHPGEAWEVTYIGPGLAMKRDGDKQRVTGTVRVARLEAGDSWSFVDLGGLTDPEGGWRRVDVRHVVVGGEP
jgi:hypothetical protein